MLILVLAAPEAAWGSGLTQRDWMRSLVEALGLSFGLPDEPEDEDYLRILSGRRTLRVEAEEALQPESLVSVKDFPHFGPFSGAGWVSGIAMPTTARLSFLLPLRGTYQVTAMVRLPGHVIHLGGQEFRASGAHEFVSVDLGPVTLEAGEQEVIVHLPPNGAIDYLDFRAPELATIAPLGGWQPERPLTREDLGATALQALDLLDILPEGPAELVIEAEDAEDTGGAAVVSIRYLGAPSGGRWLRATTSPAEVVLSVSVRRSGVYRLTLVGAGNLPARVKINDEPHREISWPSYLAETSADSVYLAAGRHRIQVDLPPGVGLDVVRLQELLSGAVDIKRLTGRAVGFEGTLADEMDDLLALLAVVGVFH
ncbi:hypothetical protein SAMN05660860_00609 [Geoalkalibacter ferrihydriticus]|nr:hypothetical protein SAMN05660860_00609 [Geoalkalibacter ferrihydriticus]